MLPDYQLNSSAIGLILLVKYYACLPISSILVYMDYRVTCATLTASQALATIRCNLFINYSAHACSGMNNKIRIYRFADPTSILDVVIANPAAPTHRLHQQSYKEAVGANKASQAHKALHYEAKRDILQAFHSSTKGINRFWQILQNSSFDG
eukprot:scaffold3747_cov258-Ochromonas_danica.AAC.2